MYYFALLNFFALLKKIIFVRNYYGAHIRFVLLVESIKYIIGLF